METPTTPLLAVSNQHGELLKCTLKFQCGLLRETETFLGDDVRYLCAESLLEYASDMLYFKVLWFVSISKDVLNMDIQSVQCCMGYLILESLSPLFVYCFV